MTDYVRAIIALGFISSFFALLSLPLLSCLDSLSGAL